VPEGARGVVLREQKPLGDDAPLAGFGHAGVLDRMFEEDQHARACSEVALVDEHHTAAQQIAVALPSDVDDGIEQRVARADEGGRGLADGRYERLLERDALVARHDGLADADQPIAIALRHRNVGDLVAARRLTLLRSAAEGV
jgi:hypothetical protein